MKSRRKIAIVGGTGGMGQVLVKELKPYADIIIISRSIEKAKQFSNKFGVQGGTLKDCNNADIIFVSVPINSTYETCQKLFQIVKPGSLIIDISAVKTHLKKLETELPDHISYISMHPLFGPDGSFKDYNVILVPIKENNWLSELQELLDNLGAITSITTIEKHDFFMSKIQVAHHFMYLILASYLSDTPIPPSFFTRSFKKTLANFQGIEKNLNAILEIQQANPYGKKTRTEIKSLVEKFISLNEAEINELMQQIKAFKKDYIIKNE